MDSVYKCDLMRIISSMMHNWSNRIFCNCFTCAFGRVCTRHAINCHVVIISIFVFTLLVAVPPTHLEYDDACVLGTVLCNVPTFKCVADVTAPPPYYATCVRQCNVSNGGCSDDQLCIGRPFCRTCAAGGVVEGHCLNTQNGMLRALFCYMRVVHVHVTAVCNDCTESTSNRVVAG